MFHIVLTVKVRGRCLIVSYESDLETRLRAYNAKILFWSSIHAKLSKFKLGSIVVNKINTITILRNSCFVELREVSRKKNPDRFLRSK